MTSKLPSVFLRERKSGKRETQFKEQRKHRAKGFFLKKILNILGRTADTNFGKVQNRPLASSDKLKTFGYTNQLLIARHVTFGLVIQSDDVCEREICVTLCIPLAPEVSIPPQGWPRCENVSTDFIRLNEEYRYIYENFSI